MKVYRLAIDALKHKYTAEMADAKFVFSLYSKHPVGVGEHPGLLEEMDNALEKWVDANDKMNALNSIVAETDNETED
tara:strand:+ start:146 stop:376 length:231 start_codon:yes stop_codon:yes gene_type:complete